MRCVTDALFLSTGYLLWEARDRQMRCVAFATFLMPIGLEGRISGLRSCSLSQSFGGIERQGFVNEVWKSMGKYL